MNRELFQDMLAARSEFTRDGDDWKVDAKSRASILLHGTSGGPVPLAKVLAVSVGDAFVTIETEDAVYCLAVSHVAGIKVDRRSDAGPARTGFHR